MKTRYGETQTASKRCTGGIWQSAVTSAGSIVVFRTRFPGCAARPGSNGLECLRHETSLGSWGPNANAFRLMYVIGWAKARGIGRDPP